MATLITAATAATTSAAFALAGEAKIISDPLGTGESVKLQEELPNGTYVDVVDDKVVLAPWMGTGSPKAQAMWIDELKIYDGYTGGSAPPVTNGTRLLPGSMRFGAGNMRIVPVE